jgi:hypothetical protein
MPGYNSQRRVTARTIPKIVMLFYVLFVLCRCVYCVCVNVFCTTATGWQPNCSLKYISYHIISFLNISIIVKTQYKILYCWYNRFVHTSTFHSFCKWSKFLKQMSGAFCPRYEWIRYSFSFIVDVLLYSFFDHDSRWGWLTLCSGSDDPGLDRCGKLRPNLNSIPGPSSP